MSINSASNPLSFIWRLDNIPNKALQRMPEDVVADWMLAIVIIGGLAAFAVILVLVNNKIIYPRENNRFDPKMLAHLSEIGLKAHGMTKEGLYPFEAGARRGKLFADNWMSQSGIKIIGTNIEAVEDIAYSTSTSNGPGGTIHFNDYLISTSSATSLNNEDLKKTKTWLEVPKKNAKSDRTDTLSWRGESRLSQRLNSDENLTNKVIELGLDTLIVMREETRAYIRIRRSDMPTRGQFDVLDAIAKHVKFVW